MCTGYQKADRDPHPDRSKQQIAAITKRNITMCNVLSHYKINLIVLMIKITGNKTPQVAFCWVYTLLILHNYVSELRDLT